MLTILAIAAVSLGGSFTLNYGVGRYGRFLSVVYDAAVEERPGC
jgi:hypothetical protein